MSALWLWRVWVSALLVVVPSGRSRLAPPEQRSLSVLTASRLAVVYWEPLAEGSYAASPSSFPSWFALWQVQYGMEGL